MDEQLVWIVRALVLAGIFGMFKMRDTQNQLKTKLDTVIKAGEAATEQAKVQLESIGTLRDVVAAQTGQMAHFVKESERSFKYHEQHFEKIGQIALKIARAGGGN
jgi:hypothetical protein